MVELSIDNTNNTVNNSKIESSMSRMVGDTTNITTSVIDQGIHRNNPLKQLKSAMPKRGNAHDDKPNRRGKVNLSVPVKLYVSGRNLKNMDMFSKSDPLCVVFEKAQDRDEWFEIGRTEFIKDTLNPNFEKAIDVDFFFEKSQQLKFEFIDDDGGDSDDPYYDIIGSSIMQLSVVMSAKGQTVSKPLVVPGKRKQRGMIIVRAESIQESNH